MAAARDPRDENIRALEQLRAGSADRPVEPHPAAKKPIPADEPIFPELPAAGSSAPARVPPVPQRRPTPQPSPRLTSSDSSPTYHCLECGYALLAQSNYRCSECGQTYDPGFLAAWFEGTEEDRFTHLTWLVSFALVLKSFAFLMVAFAPVSYQQTCVNLLVIAPGAGFLFAACVLAGRDRIDTVAVYFFSSGSSARGL